VNDVHSKVGGGVVVCLLLGSHLSDQIEHEPRTGHKEPSGKAAGSHLGVEAQIRILEDSE
jgi:hypothetical protein